MGEGDPLAFDHIASHRRRIEEQINEVIGEEINLIDVENAAIRGRE